MAKKQLPLFETEVKKRCTKCGGLKGLDEYVKAKYGKYGKSSVCKGCSSKNRYINKDKIKEHSAEYYRINRDKIRARVKVYAEKNKESLSIASKKYYLNNKDKSIRASNKYKNKNEVAIKERQRLYYLDNQEKLRKRSNDRYFANIDENKRISKIYRVKNNEAIKKRRAIYNSLNVDRIRALRKDRYYNIIVKDPAQVLRRRISCGMRRALVNGKDGRSWESLVGYNLGDLIKHFKGKDSAMWRKFVKNPSGYHIDHIIPMDAFNFDAPDQIDFKKCWSLKNLQLLPARENISKGNRIDAPFQPSLNLLFG